MTGNDMQTQIKETASIADSRDMKRRKRRKILKIALLSFIMINILVFSIIPPYIMNDMINMHVEFRKYYQAEDFGITSEQLTLTTSDGLKIRAYEVFQEQPKAVVIFISGIHNPSVTAFYDHARLLKENGYASILYEMRAHAQSEGDVISLGFKEPLDTKAVVDYISAESKYDGVPIVVYGLSMGAAVAINSIGEIEEIDGLISVSAYSAWEDVFADNMELMGMPKVICTIEKPFVKGYTTLKYGFDTYNISPKQEIKKLGKRPALILHTKGDDEVPFDSFLRIMKNAPAHVESWTREENQHFFVADDAFTDLKKDPEYSKRIIEFLDKNFAN